MYIIALMSGTSLDGLDIAYLDINQDASSAPIFRLLASATIPYSPEWRQRLSTLEHASAYDYALTHVQLGHYFGQCINTFRLRHPGPVDYVASHGHTIFHQPQLGLTTQIADGDAIAAETHLPVISNFRTLDVALGGQGAPLVPIGDRLFWGSYQACLNLGGIANISYENADQQRVAFDICPCNMPLNYLAQQLQLDYDWDGLVARTGRVEESLLQQFNNLPYYQQQPPKSLGKEWFVSQYRPLFGSHAVCDLLRTSLEHTAYQVARVVNEGNIASMMVTGGGALNTFLLERMRNLMPQCRIEVPDRKIVEYKEAIIFALLGYLRITKQVNTLASVTGASSNSIGGTLSGLW